MNKSNNETINRIETGWCDIPKGLIERQQKELDCFYDTYTKEERLKERQELINEGYLDE